MLSGQRRGQLWAVILPGNTMQACCPLFGQGAEQKAHVTCLPQSPEGLQGPPFISRPAQLQGVRGSTPWLLWTVEWDPGPSWPCSTSPFCPPSASLTVLSSCHLSQDAEGARLKVGGAAGPLISLIFRLVLVLNHSLVHGRGAVHSEVFNGKAPAMQSDRWARAGLEPAPYLLPSPTLTPGHPPPPAPAVAPTCLNPPCPFPTAI